MTRKAKGHGGQRKGAGRKHDSFKPWDRIDIVNRYYLRLGEISKSEGRRAVYETDLTLYAEDFPDKVSLHDGESVRERIKVLDECLEHFACYRETQEKLRARGKSEAQAMTDGFWDEWFRARWDKRLKRLQSHRHRST